jgi:hypothetical protein
MIKSNVRGAPYQNPYRKCPWSKNIDSTENPLTLNDRIIEGIQDSSTHPHLKSRKHPSFPASSSFYSDTSAHQLGAEVHRCPRNHQAALPAQYSAELRFDGT